MNRLIALGAAVVVVLILLSSTLFTVHQTQQVLITQFGEPIRVIREEHDDIVIVGISVSAGGYEKHTVFVPTTQLTNSQYADYLEFRPELGPAEALATVLEG